MTLSCSGERGGLADCESCIAEMAKLEVVMHCTVGVTHAMEGVQPDLLFNASSGGRFCVIQPLTLFESKLLLPRCTFPHSCRDVSRMITGRSPPDSLCKLHFFVHPDRHPSAATQMNAV